jgi:hypothetical protein
MKYEETEKLRMVPWHEKRALFGEVHHALTKHASIDHTRYAVGEPLLMAERNGPRKRALDDGWQECDLKESDLKVEPKMLGLRVEYVYME